MCDLWALCDYQTIIILIIIIIHLLVQRESLGSSPLSTLDSLSQPP